MRVRQGETGWVVLPNPIETFVIARNILADNGFGNQWEGQGDAVVEVWVSSEILYPEGGINHGVTLAELDQIAFAIQPNQAGLDLSAQIPVRAALMFGRDNTGDESQDHLFLPITVDGSGNLVTSAPAGTTDVNIVSPLPVPVSDNGGSLTVDVGTALPAGGNNIGDVDVLTLPSLPAGANNIGDVDVLTLPNTAAAADNTANPTLPGVRSFGFLWDGATWDRFPGTSASGALVNVGTIVPVALDATTLAALETITANQGTAAAETAPWIVRGPARATYHALYRLAARPYALSNVFAAAGRKQYATIFHASSPVKTVRLIKVLVSLKAASAAAIVVAELIRITAAPATGNPAIVPVLSQQGDANAEATCLALPTTAGTEAGLPYAQIEWNLGVTGAASVVNPPPAENWYTLWEWDGLGDYKCPIMRASSTEGYAVTIDCNAAATITGNVLIVFTEE
jgi:hypothetical protein